MAKPNRQEHTETTPLIHGGAILQSVVVDDYNNEMRGRTGFIGDDANKKTFRLKLDELRRRMRELNRDPLGAVPTKEISKKKIDGLLRDDNPEAVALVLGAIEGFSRDFADVIRKFMKDKSWSKTKRIVVGGGFRQRRVGELAIARTMMLLRNDEVDVEIVPIAHHPDEAGLIGAVHLMPDWMLKGHAAILAVDIGGTNVRAGIVEFRNGKIRHLDDAKVRESIMWRHADEKPSRTATIAKLASMLEDLIKNAKAARIKLAPFIGIGCPGVIEVDGSITRGGQNLPGGNWESDHFNLPAELMKTIPQIEGSNTFIIMHNDAVVQGLSQVPLMRDVASWAVLTIGTGLGNAHFTNRVPQESSA
jgi:hypothetical protein